MSSTEILSTLPYFGSLMLTTGVLFYAWQRRNATGALAYTVYVGGQTLWIAGFILELLTPNLPGKIFWDAFQWLASIITILAFPVFAFQYTDYTLRNPRLLLWMSLIIPSVFTTLLFTDSFHHWLYPNPKLITSNPFQELTYSFTPVVYVFAAYSYSVLLWGLFLLSRRFTRNHKLYRTQMAIIIVGFLIPIAGTMLSLFGIHITPQRDSTPITIALGNLIVAWGLFRFQIFEVVPVSRDQAFEAIMDPVVILDHRDIIIDVNGSMLELLGLENSEVIGKSAKIIFDDFPIPIKLYSSVSYARAETSFEIRGKTVYYEMTIWPVYNNHREIVSRLYISHDITALKELEKELRNLNNELEARVEERTSELAASYDYTLEGWAKALELRDKETEGHSRRVTESTVKVARALDIPENQIDHIRRGAILHDIGKMAIPDEILLKPGSLTKAERKIIEQHPVSAYQLLERIPYLHQAIEIPYCHHERWDGSGYPRGLKERQIPISARIFAVADVWDALRSDRPYSKEWPKEDAITYLIEQSGKQFDPRIVNIFLELVDRGEV